MSDDGTAAAVPFTCAQPRARHTPALRCALMGLAGASIFSLVCASKLNEAHRTEYIISRSPLHKQQS